MKEGKFSTLLPLLLFTLYNSTSSLRIFCDQNKPLLADMKNKSVCEGKKLK